MKKATELHNFFSTQKVAFLGDSMSGKSSLINSLLDFPRLAAADDFGSAVTSIVTEYRQKRPSQTQRIQVEVEYFHGVTMEAHIMELLWSSRRVFLPNVAQNSLSAADWNEIKEKSKQAWSALQSAFGSQVGFSKRFLSDQSEGAFERITEQLIRWSKTIPWPTSADDGRWVAFAETAEELLDKTSVFTKTQVWPFTKIMRIYVDAPILKAGFVIADLPGLLDKNLARVQATQDYISTCDRVFHVVDIRRALTSQSLESALNMTAPSPSANEEEPTNRWSQSAVICTMSDEIDEIGAERHLQSSGSVKTLMTMETLDEEIRKANLEEDSSQLRKLQSKKRTLLIQARNERVENGLKTTYNSSKSDDLQVFCVSNVFYSKCRFQKSDPTVLNQLEDALSNIPALRKFCYSTLANSRLHEAKNFILSALPSYIASICLHFQPLESGPTCSLDEILKEVDLNKESILNTIHYSRKKVNELFEMRINGHFNRYRETWQKEAIQKGEEWLSMPAVEYQAFCRKNGKHVDIWDEPVDWNSELIGIIQPALGSVWNDLEKDVSSYTSVLHRDLDKIFAVLKYSLSLKNFPSFLIESISWREQEIRQAIEKSWGELRREMQSIRAKALGSNENSFILRAMLPAYRAAASFDGNFKGKELHEKVQGRIKDSMLFQDMVSAASSEMHLASQRLEERLKTDIAKDRFSAIVGDVCSVYSTITLAKTDDEEEKQTSEETMSLESLKFKCRGLKARHNYIAKFMYLY
ncbi:hypothetical protein N7462_011589 [Penicillium macrosclerotiorum]|uniref:uncharacterized protein n=1 Tax=Penicillium macrosclerotiorum TaxID=303699 RepID=UPI002548CBCE|nr:uncharacterized protein N7462_011589 [Penicillium macrosclerotiorum]KAJ5662663.1 hypothetical protein N7462_011589 [Penicillium macrosclerotiorum]